jgi:oligoendopeptidase F
MPDFANLQRYEPRRFAPDNLDPADWSQIETLYDRLVETNLATAAALEQFLRRWNELGDVLNEEFVRRYFAMTCQTDDADAADAYRYFVTDIVPRRKSREYELERHYLAAPARSQMPAARYAVFDREVAARSAIFREANVPLETQEELLAQDYQTLMGGLTVMFDGEEKTIAQLSPVLEETDRTRRHAAWLAMNERRYQERERIEALFDQLLALRVQIATNAGYANYRDYKFAQLQRFDYTPEDCFAFHAAVAQHVVPLVRKIQARRCTRMGLDTLRPWDTAVDPLGRPPLRPFANAGELIDGTMRLFAKVDPQLAREFREMQQAGMLDLENHKGKAPGGYQEFLPETRIPLIFMNAVGTQSDVETLLHEGGHAFNAFATRGEWLSTYRSPPIEFSEVASMAMELLGADYLNEFYPPNEAQRAREQHLEGIASIFGWIAAVDAFQHWLYTHPQHSAAERGAQWAVNFQRFMGDIDWSGLEPYLQTLWHRQLHIFEVPFYYVEYGIAQLGALQVWKNMRQNCAAAVAAYKRGLAAGGSLPLPQVYEAAGIKFDFSAATVAPLMEMVAKNLGL